MSIKASQMLSRPEKHDPGTCLSTEAQQFPLRITLVWTDPPGNPGAALKLVNDLDLVVRESRYRRANLSMEIISLSAVISLTPSATNSLPANDFVNNVENVYLNGPSWLELLDHRDRPAGQRERSATASQWDRAGFCARCFLGQFNLD